MFTNPVKSEPRTTVTPKKPARLSRRAAMAIAVTAPLAIRTAAATESEVALKEIIRRTEEQAAAFNSGDMQRWYELIRLSDDFTLMQPFGGPASHGFDGSPEHLAELANHFRNGEAKLEVAQILRVGRHDRSGYDRTAARRSLRLAGSGLVLAGHAGLPSCRLGMATRAPARRSVGPSDRAGTGGRTCPGRVTRTNWVPPYPHNRMRGIDHAAEATADRSAGNPR